MRVRSFSIIGFPASPASVAHFALTACAILLNYPSILIAQSADKLIEQTRSAWNQRTERTQTCVIIWEERVFYPKGSLNAFFTQLPHVENSSPIPSEDTRFTHQIKLTLNGNQSHVIRNDHIWSARDHRYNEKKLEAAQDGTNETYHAANLGQNTSMGYITSHRGNIGCDASTWPMRVALRGLDKDFMDNYDLSTYSKSNDSMLAEHGYFQLSTPAGDVGNTMRMTIEPRRMFFPMTLESRNVNGAVVGRCQVFELQEVAHGVLLPKRWKYMGYSGSKLLKQYECQLLTFDVNADVSGTPFRLDFPVGTRVSDQSGANGTVREFVVTAPSVKREILTKERLLATEKLMSTNPGELTGERLGIRVYYYLIGASALLIAIAMIIVVRRKRLVLTMKA